MRQPFSLPSSHVSIQQTQISAQAIDGRSDVAVNNDNNTLGSLSLYHHRGDLVGKLEIFDQVVISKLGGSDSGTAP
jgi:hypothetical protein